MENDPTADTSGCGPSGGLHQEGVKAGRASMNPARPGRRSHPTDLPPLMTEAAILRDHSKCKPAVRSRSSFLSFPHLCPLARAFGFSADRDGATHDHLSLFLGGDQR